MNAREQWLAERRQGIGASDIAAVLGISPFATPLELYLDKIGETPDKEDEPQMRRGRRLEPLVLDFYAEETGRAVTRQQECVVGAEPWMRATLDGFDAAAVAPVEAKTVNAFAAQDFGDAWTDEVPLNYAAQVHWQMMLTDAGTGYLAALIGSDDFRIFELKRDRDLEKMLVARAREFWQRVQDRRPPDPVTLEDVGLLYRRDKGLTIEATPEIAAIVGDLKALKAEIKQREARADHLAMQIKAAMGDAAILLGANGKPLATWKNNKDGVTTDWEGAFLDICGGTLNDAAKEIVADHTSTKTGNRPLLLK